MRSLKSHNAVWTRDLSFSKKQRTERSTNITIAPIVIIMSEFVHTYTNKQINKYYTRAWKWKGIGEKIHTKGHHDLSEARFMKPINENSARTHRDRGQTAGALYSTPSNCSALHKSILNTLLKMAYHRPVQKCREREVRIGDNSILSGRTESYCHHHLAEQRFSHLKLIVIYYDTTYP